MLSSSSANTASKRHQTRSAAPSTKPPQPTRNRIRASLAALDESFIHDPAETSHIFSASESFLDEFIPSNVEVPSAIAPSTVKILDPLFDNNAPIPTRGSRKRGAPSTTRGPAKRRRTKENPSTTPAMDALQGISPVISSSTCSDPPVTSVDTQIVMTATKPRPVGSPFWKYVYPLDSDEQPSRYFIDPSVVRVKPNVKFLGCRICNEPSADGLASFAWQTWQKNEGVISNIKRHVRDIHPDVFATIMGTTTTTTAPLPFSLEDYIDKIITWIIADDQALRVVDSDTFRQMITYPNPTIMDNDIPHCSAIQMRILKRYDQDREALRAVLRESVGRISLTSDLWSDSNMTSFMAVTLHWIARTPKGDFELKTALGGFRWIRDKHSGENIAARFIEILNELEILHKIGAITMDNASNNDTAMDVFARELCTRNITYVPEQQRLCCFDHAINRAVQDALAALPFPQLDLRTICDEDLKAVWRQGQADISYCDALKTDIVGRIHDLTQKLRASGQRREALAQTIIAGNRDKRFAEPIKQLELLRPVSTRWSSQYFMIGRFNYLSPAINLFLETPNVASLNRDDTLNVKESTVAKDIQTFLSYFHAAQDTLACEKTPTLPFVLPLYEELIGALKDLCYVQPKLMHAILLSLTKIEKYVKKCRASYMYMLAMVLHPGVKLEWLSGTWEKEEIDTARATTLAAMILHSPAKTCPTPPVTGPTTPTGPISSEQSLNRRVNALRAMRAKLATPSRIGTPEPEGSPAPAALSLEEQKKVAEEAAKKAAEMELSDYLSEPLLDTGTDASFIGILSYWKTREFRFPRLFALAMTVLAAPATSVPSERVFSSSGRTTTHARNRLSPVIVEALQILKFNHRHHVLDFTGFTVAEIKEMEAVQLDEVTDQDLINIRDAQNSKE